MTGVDRVFSTGASTNIFSCDDGWIVYLRAKLERGFFGIAAVD